MKNIPLSKKQILFILLISCIVVSVTSAIIGNEIKSNNNKEADSFLGLLVVICFNPRSANFTVKITSDTDWTAAIDIKSYGIFYGPGNFTFGEINPDCSFSVTQTSSPGYVTVECFKDGKVIYSETIFNAPYFTKLQGSFTTRLITYDTLFMIYSTGFYKSLYITGILEVYPVNLIIYSSAIPIFFIVVGLLEVYGKMEAYGKIKNKLPSKKKKKLVVFLQKCPACKAPLNKKIPCKCDYCGTVINKIEETDKIKEFSYVSEEGEEDEEEEEIDSRPRIIPRYPEYPSGQCAYCGRRLRTSKERRNGICNYCR